MNRCMYQVLLIQLHYPLISKSRSQPTTPDSTRESLTVCATAAKQTFLLLSAYNRTFSISKAPYLIAYATYVSATVHVRVAAQRAPDAETLACLRTCLGWLSQNQNTNPGAANAKASLNNLVRRMGVVCQEEPDILPPQQEPDQHSLAQYPVPRSYSSSRIMSSSPEATFASRRTPVSRERTHSNPYKHLDMDMVLKHPASDQLSDTSPSSTSFSDTTALGSYSAAPAAGFETSTVNTFGSGLLDPFGMSLDLSCVGGGELQGPFVGSTAFGSTMDYSQSWQGSDIGLR